MAIAAGATGATGQTQSSTTASSGSFTVHIGDCVIVAVSNPTLTSYQVTDNLGNTYSLAGLSGAAHQLWICLPVTVAGSCIVTATTATAPTTLFVTAQVYTGVGSLGQIGTAVSNTTIPWASPAITTVTGNWLVGQFYQAIAGSVNTAVSPTILRATSYTGGVSGVITLADVAATANGALQVEIQPSQGVAMYRHAIELVAAGVTPPPALSSMSPTSGVQGTTVPVTLTGTGFTGATGLTVSGTGVTVSNFTVVSDTSITASLVIAVGAATGVRTVLVNSPNGNSNTVNFTVNAAPSITVSATSPTITFGNAAQSTLTVTYLNGAAGPVTLSAPSPGGIGYGWAPNPIPAGSTQSVLTLNSENLAVGTHTYTLTATAATGGSASTNITVTVNAAPSFTLTVTPDTVTFPAGSTGAQATVTIVPSGGFSSPVTLSVAPIPGSSTTATFSPNPATTTSTITVTSNSPGFDQILTISGTGGGVTSTVNLTVNVEPFVSTAMTKRNRTVIKWGMRKRIK